LMCEEEKTFQMERRDTIISLNIICGDVISLIMKYDKVEYCLKPIKVFKNLKIQCSSIICDQKERIYLCDSIQKQIFNLNNDGEVIKTLFRPKAYSMDFYQNNFYVVGEDKIFLLNFNFEIVSSFSISNLHNSTEKIIKVDDSLIYLTIGESDFVYVYTNKGQIHQLVNQRKSNIIQLSRPYALAFNSDLLYVSDICCYFIFVFSKKDYSFEKAWGGYGKCDGIFFLPFSLYYWEDILYVGDSQSVQLFEKNGSFLQRLGGPDRGNKEGEFANVYGLCMIKNQLYVSDDLERIQVFENI